MIINHQQLTSEEKVLLSLCQLEFREKQKADICDLMKKVKDWNNFVQLANKHGIIALIAYNIRENGLTNQVPDATMKMLDNGHMQSIVRNTWLIKRWKEVNTILTEAGIKHVLLKGMALEHTVYGAKGLRQMTDNDILVKKNDVMKTWLLLQKHGFESEMIKSPLYKKVIIDIGKHMPALGKEGYLVEIHHRLFDEPIRNELLDKMFDNPLTIKVDGTTAYILHEDIHLGFLKKHLLHHMVSGETQLKLFLDLELIRPGSAPPFPYKFLNNPNQSSEKKFRMATYRAHFKALPGKIKFRYLLGDIFPSLRWMKQRHGCGWVRALLYYPRRLGKLIWLLKA